MIKIEVDSREITAALQRLSQRVDNLYPVFDDIGAGLVANIQSQLGQGETPWGEAFKRLKATRGRRVGGVPLNDTRQHIYDRIDHIASSNAVEVGWYGDSLLGAAHQFGSEKKNIPARPFLPIRNGAADLPQSWEQEILDTITRHIQQAF